MTPKIKQKGLVPQVGSLSKTLGETKKGVYLFGSKLDLENALLNWLGEELEEIPEGELAILEINLPNNFKLDHDESIGFEYISKETIPWKYIKVLRFE